MRRLGLDYATLEKRFPGLIYCACYGYSEQGPYAGRAAIDDTIQAASGMAWLQGGAGAQAPRYVNSVIADKVVALCKRRDQRVARARAGAAARRWRCPCSNAWWHSSRPSTWPA